MKTLKFLLWVGDILICQLHLIFNFFSQYILNSKQFPSKKWQFLIFSQKFFLPFSFVCIFSHTLHLLSFSSTLDWVSRKTQRWRCTWKSFIRKHSQVNPVENAEVRQRKTEKMCDMKQTLITGNPGSSLHAVFEDIVWHALELFWAGPGIWSI